MRLTVVRIFCTSRSMMNRPICWQLDRPTGQRLQVGLYTLSLTDLFWVGESTIFVVQQLHQRAARRFDEFTVGSLDRDRFRQRVYIYSIMKTLSYFTSSLANIFDRRLL